MLDEYYLSVNKGVQEFDATDVIEWDGVCKGLLRGEVRCFKPLLLAVEQIAAW